MSEALGRRARQLAGLAGRMLGWRPHEFWSATPAELAAILVPEADGGSTPLSRSDLTRMMEHDDAEPRA